MGSRRNSPIAPKAAAVISLATMVPRKVPWVQLLASLTSGTTEARRPPNRMALIGTPWGSSHSSAITGHCAAGAVKRAFGWAAFSSESGVQSLPFQSVRCAGASSVISSHQTSPSSVSATLVNTEFFSNVRMALGFDFIFVPGATPKKPASGLIAWSHPSSPNFIQQISSPMVSTFQPGILGVSMARLVLPQALGKAPAIYRTFPSGLVIFRISMCSASQPSSRAKTDAIRRAKHFLPKSALPPYPEPNDHISRVSG